MNNEEEADTAACDHVEQGDHAKGPLTFDYFKHLHDLFGRSTLYALENDSFFGWSTVESVCLTAPALLLVFATPGEETVFYLHIERPARCH